MPEWKNRFGQCCDIILALNCFSILVCTSLVESPLFLRLRQASSHCQCRATVFAEFLHIVYAVGKVTHDMYSCIHLSINSSINPSIKSARSRSNLSVLPQQRGGHTESRVSIIAGTATVLNTVGPAKCRAFSVTDPDLALVTSFFVQ